MCSFPGPKRPPNDFVVLCNSTNDLGKKRQVWLYIDSAINHIRHFIKIQFEFINLPSIFKDKSVISSIPTYFENEESPIICYK